MEHGTSLCRWPKSGGPRIKVQARASPASSPPPGLVSSQDAPSPLFLPGFLLPFPVPHPVLGAWAEENTLQRDWDLTEANGSRASGCYGTRSRVRTTAMTYPSWDLGVHCFIPLPPWDSGTRIDSLFCSSPLHPTTPDCGLRTWGLPLFLRAMLSGERKEGGSPRFGKLHLPVGLWINSPRKQLAKLGRRWPSAASVK